MIVEGHVTGLFDVTGKVALVTGAGTGIGRALAIGLSGAGMKVVAADIAEGPLAETVSQILASGGTISSTRTDVSVRADVEAMLDLVERTYGQLDLLVNNAGINVSAPVLELDLESWKRVLDVNLTGVFLCSQAAARLMTRAGGGSIVNISSQLADVARPGRSVYCTSKAGVKMLTKAMAIDLGPHGIRVNALAPGPIEVERTLLMFQGPEGESFRSRMVLGRYGQPEELVGAVIFLASAASSFVTGSSVLVDGGYTTT
jgi:NAD(P)-dependent dehydrogenase (short-subunit alcohol dehydrogenase family)